jgi:hypothetical protein
MASVRDTKGSVPINISSSSSSIQRHTEVLVFGDTKVSVPINIIVINEDLGQLTMSSLSEDS